MRAHIEALKKVYDVTLVANGKANDLSGLLDRQVSFIPLQIERKISIKNDVLALIALWRLFRKEKFDCIHSIMPKSGLLSMLAARLAGVPMRLHTFTGQVWATKKGFPRFALRFLDKVLANCAIRVLADSHSQRMFLLENNVVKPNKIVVLAEGSIAGVDVNRFKYNPDARCQIRAHNKIPDNAIVFLFLGRLNRDKGVPDLAQAFASAAIQNTDLHLMIVGSDEEGLDAELMTLAHRFPGRVSSADFTNCPEEYMSAAEVLCLPSYREGFGTVIIEAASVGLPAIASNIYGITDAVEDGITGILHQPGSVREIAEAMLLFATDRKLCRRMGNAARERAINKFSERIVTKAFADFYGSLFSANDTVSRRCRY